jgi:alpha-tubulin suppressor-like RCC1 family protein
MYYPRQPAQPPVCTPYNVTIDKAFPVQVVNPDGSFLSTYYDPVWPTAGWQNYTTSPGVDIGDYGVYKQWYDGMGMRCNLYQEQDAANYYVFSYMFNNTLGENNTVWINGPVDVTALVGNRSLSVVGSALLNSYRKRDCAYRCLNWPGCDGFQFDTNSISCQGLSLRCHDKNKMYVSASTSVYFAAPVPLAILSTTKAVSNQYSTFSGRGFFGQLNMANLGGPAFSNDSSLAPAPAPGPAVGKTEREIVSLYKRKHAALGDPWDASLQFYLYAKSPTRDRITYSTFCASTYDGARFDRSIHCPAVGQGSPTTNTFGNKSDVYGLEGGNIGYPFFQNIFFQHDQPPQPYPNTSLITHASWYSGMLLGWRATIQIVAPSMWGNDRFLTYRTGVDGSHYATYEPAAAQQNDEQYWYIIPQPCVSPYVERASTTWGSFRKPKVDRIVDGLQKSYFSETCLNHDFFVQHNCDWFDCPLIRDNATLMNGLGGYEAPGRAFMDFVNTMAGSGDLAGRMNTYMANWFTALDELQDGVGLATCGDAWMKTLGGEGILSWASFETCAVRIHAWDGKLLYYDPQPKQLAQTDLTSSDFTSGINGTYSPTSIILESQLRVVPFGYDDAATTVSTSGSFASTGVSSTSPTNSRWGMVWRPPILLTETVASYDPNAILCYMADDVPIFTFAYTSLVANCEVCASGQPDYNIEAAGWHVLTYFPGSNNLLCYYNASALYTPGSSSSLFNSSFYNRYSTSAFRSIQRYGTPYTTVYADIGPKYFPPVFPPGALPGVYLRQINVTDFLGAFTSCIVPVVAEILTTLDIYTNSVIANTKRFVYADAFLTTNTAAKTICFGVLGAVLDCLARVFSRATTAEWNPQTWHSTPRLHAALAARVPLAALAPQYVDANDITPITATFGALTSTLLWSTVYARLAISSDLRACIQATGAEHPWLSYEVPVPPGVSPPPTTVDNTEEVATILEDAPELADTDLSAAAVDQPNLFSINAAYKAEIAEADALFEARVYELELSIQDGDSSFSVLMALKSIQAENAIANVYASVRYGDALDRLHPTSEITVAEDAGPATLETADEADEVVDGVGDTPPDVPQPEGAAAVEGETIPESAIPVAEAAGGAEGASTAVAADAAAEAGTALVADAAGTVTFEFAALAASAATTIVTTGIFIGVQYGISYAVCHAHHRFPSPGYPSPYCCSTFKLTNAYEFCETPPSPPPSPPLPSPPPWPPGPASNSIPCSTPVSKGNEFARVHIDDLATYIDMADGNEVTIDLQAVFGNTMLHCCAIAACFGQARLSAGAKYVTCWGSNAYGQLGSGTLNNSLVATPVVSLLDNVGTVVAGGNHTCVLDTTGGVHCWGQNNHGQLGDGTYTNRTVAVAVALTYAAGALIIGNGGAHTCTVSSNIFAVECWGDNSNGQLGVGTTSDASIPQVVPGQYLLGLPVAVAAGSLHTCTLLSYGAVQCWGANMYGQLGDGSTYDSWNPGAALLMSTAASLTAGYQHTCALLTSGSVTCWGMNSNGQLGDGTNVSRTSPVAVAGLAGPVASIAAGGLHTCALLASGGVQCWGFNANGELGVGQASADVWAPVSVPGAQSGVVSIAASGHHTCAVLTGGASVCWGLNADGELGNNNTTAAYSPQGVYGLSTGVVSVAPGEHHTCAVIEPAAAQVEAKSYSLSPQCLADAFATGVDPARAGLQYAAIAYQLNTTSPYIYLDNPGSPVQLIDFPTFQSSLNGQCALPPAPPLAPYGWCQVPGSPFYRTYAATGVTQLEYDATRDIWAPGCTSCPGPMTAPAPYGIVDLQALVFGNSAAFNTTNSTASGSATGAPWFQLGLGQYMPMLSDISYVLPTGERVLKNRWNASSYGTNSGCGGATLTVIDDRAFNETLCRGLSGGTGEITSPTEDISEGTTYTDTYDSSGVLVRSPPPNATVNVKTHGGKCVYPTIAGSPVHRTYLVLDPSKTLDQQLNPTLPGGAANPDYVQPFTYPTAGADLLETSGGLEIIQCGVLNNATTYYYRFDRVMNPVPKSNWRVCTTLKPPGGNYKGMLAGGGPLDVAPPLAHAPPVPAPPPGSMCPAVNGIGNAPPGKAGFPYHWSSVVNLADVDARWSSRMLWPIASPGCTNSNPNGTAPNCAPSDNVVNATTGTALIGDDGTPYWIRLPPTTTIPLMSDIFPPTGTPSSWTNAGYPDYSNSSCGSYSLAVLDNFQGSQGFGVGGHFWQAGNDFGEGVHCVPFVKTLNSSFTNWNSSTDASLATEYESETSTSAPPNQVVHQPYQCFYPTVAGSPVHRKMLVFSPTDGTSLAMKTFRTTTDMPLGIDVTIVLCPSSTSGVGDRFVDGAWYEYLYKFGSLNHAVWNSGASPTAHQWRVCLKGPSAPQAKFPNPAPPSPPAPHPPPPSPSPPLPPGPTAPPQCRAG